MVGYVIKGTLLGNCCLDTSDILDDTVYLSKDMAVTECVLKRKLNLESKRRSERYLDFIIEEVKIK